MPREQAYVEFVHVDPQSGRVSQMSVNVQHRQGTAQVHILLEPPLDGGMPMTEVAAAQLRLLGEALSRIAEAPSAIRTRDPQGM
jgi:anti-sigma factor RsiW